jgi:uncharacterized protein YndB with AHSA1/START domain
MNQSNLIEPIVKEVTIKAPAARVFDAITDPRQRVKWWGRPGRFEVTEMESDLRPGGRWLMRGLGQGKPFVISGEYRAVDRPTLLEFTWFPDWSEPQSIVRFELTETEGATIVRLTHSGLSDQMKIGYQGWPSLLASLQKHVEAAS